MGLKTKVKNKAGWSGIIIIIYSFFI